MYSFDGKVKKLERARIPIALLALVLTVLAMLGGCGSGSTRAVVGDSFTSCFESVYDRMGGMLTISAGGDVNFGNGVTPYISSGGLDYPLGAARGTLESSDLAFVNLECCISSGGRPVPGKEFCFRGPADTAECLALGGVDVVSLSNNHAKDYGDQALLDTMDNLQKRCVVWCGAGENIEEAYAPAVMDVRGRKVAFLAFTSVVPYGWPATSSSCGCATTYDRDMVSEAIKEASRANDVVVASFHWGIELQTSPNGDQRALAHLAIDSGADLVLGHHPHVVQGFELYRDGFIAYSLGNFVFSPPRRISSMTLAVVALLGDQGFVQAEIVPMAIRSCRPVLMEGQEASGWLETVCGYCRDLGTMMLVEDGRGYVLRKAETGATGTGRTSP